MEKTFFEGQEPQKEREPEVITDPERFRQTMRQFWHKEVDSETLKKELESKEEDYIKELSRLGYNWEVLRLRTAKERGEQAPADKNSFLFASQNETKQGLVAKAAEKQGMFIQEVLFRPGAEEEMEHQILKQLIGEARRMGRHPHGAVPAVRRYDPARFSIDVAEAKVSKMREVFKNRVIVGGDIVVLQDDQILEKPKNRKEALQTLKNVSGKEVKASLGVVLLTPTGFGKAILLKEGAYLTTKLRQFSGVEAKQYLKQSGGKYRDAAGVLDYADPQTRKLISDTPIKIEALEFGRRAGEISKAISISSDILPQLKDYFMGVPNELIEEMLSRAKNLR